MTTLCICDLVETSAERDARLAWYGATPTATPLEQPKADRAVHPTDSRTLSNSPTRGHNQDYIS